MTSPTSVDFNNASMVSTMELDSSVNPDFTSLATELVIAKLVGGVRVAIGIDYLVLDKNSYSEVMPTKTHCDIVLMTPDAVYKLKEDYRPNVLYRGAFDDVQVCIVSKLGLRCFSWIQN